jgi:pyruvate/2-oxoglutarate dehydrogenase complex dihydrolipoamide acyltransferase (E2) component
MRRALLLLAFALPAPAQAYVIAPGVRANFPMSSCTLNFVFDGTGPAAGRVFAGAAAHCGERVGDAVRVGDGLGQVGEVVGAVAARGAYPDDDPDVEIDNDWLLVEIQPRFHADVDPAVQGHPEFPARVTTTAEMRSQDVLQFSGWGNATEATQPTREQRQGYWLGGDDRSYEAVVLVSPGDSGGPVVDVKTGGALGIVSTVVGVFATPGFFLQGPTVSQLIAQAAAQGLPVQMRIAGAKAPPRPEPASPPAPAEPAPAEAAPPAAAPPRAAKPRPTCRQKAKRIKRARKRRAALKRCAKRR